MQFWETLIETSLFYLPHLQILWLWNWHDVCLPSWWAVMLIKEIFELSEPTKRDLLNNLVSWKKKKKEFVLNIHWKDWCWSWSSNTLATCCEDLTHWKSHRCWEKLKVGGEGDNRGWDGWMAPLSRWTWVLVSSGSWWWTGKSGVLQSMVLQRGRHD